MKRLFLISLILIVFITISTVSADENNTLLKSDSNPVEDIEVSYGDIYGDVLPNKDNTYDLYISNIPNKCEADEFNLFIDNENVNYKVIEYSKDFNQLYGQYKYNFTQSKHNLKVEFTGNDHYNAHTKSFDFEVTPAIIYIPKTVTDGISMDRSVEVYLAENINGELKIIADGKEFQTKYISESRNLFPLESLGFGTHNIKVTFKNITKTRKIDVTYYFQADFYGDELITVTLPWNHEKTPNIYIDGEKYEYNADGITYTKIGTHNLVATYPGDSKYPAKTINATFTVRGEDKIVSQKSKIVMYYKDSKKAKFIVYGLDKITVKINSYTKTINVKNNTAIFTIPVLKPGSYKIVAKAKLLYAQTDLVVKHVLSIAKSSVKKSAKKLTLTATLKSGKTPIKYKKVTFIFKGKKYIKKTNSKGIAKVTITKSVLNKLKVGSKVIYKAIYGKDRVKRTVKVLK